MMAGTTEQRRVTLPASVMLSAKAISSDPSMHPQHRLSGVLMLIYGWAWVEQQTKIDPRDLAVPKSQWLAVAECLTHGVPEDAISAVNLGMSFVNSGPSSYND